mgnify:FL=1
MKIFIWAGNLRTYLGRGQAIGPFSAIVVAGTVEEATGLVRRKECEDGDEITVDHVFSAQMAKIPPTESIEVGVDEKPRVIALLR